MQIGDRCMWVRCSGSTTYRRACTILKIHELRVTVQEDDGTVRRVATDNLLPLKTHNRSET